MLAIIGGTGLSRIEEFQSGGFKRVSTPFSDKRVIVELYNFGDKKIAFLPRHGTGHSVPPHRINYRANIYALKEMGCTHILAVTACGSLRKQIEPGDFIFLCLKQYFLLV